MGTGTIERHPGKLPEVLLGGVLIVLTTFMPYLNLINVFPFAGIILSGALATWIYIIRHQVPLTYREAFALGVRSGIVGGGGVLLVIYLLLEKVRGLSLNDFQKQLADWSGRMPGDAAELYQQVMTVVNAPPGVKLLSFMLSLLLLCIIFAPLCGLGSRLTVYLLKLQARRRG